MIYRVLADLVLVLHFGFILFVVLGGLLVLRRRWVMWLHLPAAAWGALIEFFGWPCPLTPLEKQLRQLGGEAGYTGGFIEHYVGALIYPDEFGRGIQIVLGVLVVVINALIYWWVFRRRRGRASAS